MSDIYEEFLEQEVVIAERTKENFSCQDTRNIYIGQIAGLKAALTCYRMFKKFEKRDAGAPDMLKALEEIKSASDFDNWTSESALGGMLRKCNDLAEAAIAKGKDLRDAKPGASAIGES